MRHSGKVGPFWMGPIEIRAVHFLSPDSPLARPLVFMLLFVLLLLLLLLLPCCVSAVGVRVG